MTDSTSDRDEAWASHAERAHLRHEQLFAQPQRISPLNRDVHAKQIIAATTKLSNAVRCKDGPRFRWSTVPEMVATLVRYPELWDRFTMLSAQVLSVRAKLPARARQLAIMRTVWLCGAPYQWGEHLARTSKAGISQQEIEKIKEGFEATAGMINAFDTAPGFARANGYLPTRADAFGRQLYARVAASF